MMVMRTIIDHHDNWVQGGGDNCWLLRFAGDNQGPDKGWNYLDNHAHNDGDNDGDDYGDDGGDDEKHQ